MKKGKGEEQKNLDKPEPGKRKALLELFEMSQEGFTPKDKGMQTKQKGLYPYGYGLGFSTRIRLLLRILNLRKTKSVILLGSLGWFALLLLIFQWEAEIPDNIIRLLIIPPFFMVGCLGFLFQYRGEFPSDGYNEPSTKRGWFAITQGLIMMIFGFSLTIALIVQIIQALSFP